MNPNGDATQIRNAAKEKAAWLMVGYLIVSFAVGNILFATSHLADPDDFMGPPWLMIHYGKEKTVTECLVVAHLYASPMLLACIHQCWMGASKNQSMDTKHSKTEAQQEEKNAITCTQSPKPGKYTAAEQMEKSKHWSRRPLPILSISIGPYMAAKAYVYVASIAKLPTIIVPTRYVHTRALYTGDYLTPSIITIAYALTIPVL